MNGGLVRLAKFVRDLLGQPEFTVVRLGRANQEREDFTALQIVIDAISPAETISQATEYDGDAEVMTYALQYQLATTINFYGDGAYNELQRFAMLRRSENGLSLQKSLGLEVYTPRGFTDLKFLTGEQYSERFELNCTIVYTETVTENILRIDTASGTIQTERGVNTWQTLAT